MWVSVGARGENLSFWKSFSGFFFGTLMSEQMVVGSILACSQD